MSAPLPIFKKLLTTDGKGRKAKAQLLKEVIKKVKPNMKLFVWRTNWDGFYAPGMAVILAHDLDEATRMLREKVGDYQWIGIKDKHEVFELDEPLFFLREVVE